MNDTMNLILGVIFIASGLSVFCVIFWKEKTD